MVYSLIPTIPINGLGMRPMYIHYSPQPIYCLSSHTHSVVESAHISDHNTTMFCVYLTVPTYGHTLATSYTSLVLLHMCSDLLILSDHYRI